VSAARGDPAPYVFISYAAEDRPVIDRLVAGLTERHGVQIGWDFDPLRSGDAWAARWPYTVGRTAAALVVWTRASAGSRAVLAEADRARADSVLVPVTIGGLDVVPDRFRDMPVLDLTGWTDDAADPRLLPLADELRRRLLAKPDVEADTGRSTENTPVVSPAPATSPAADLAPETTAILDWAAGVQQARSAGEVEGVDVLLGALAAARARVATRSAVALYDALPAPDSLDTALRVAGITDPTGVAPVDAAGVVAPRLNQAAAIARHTGGRPEVGVRHLLAATLGGPLPADVLRTLHPQDGALIDRLRTYVADAWPGESAGWADVLPAPDVELTATFAADLVAARRKGQAAGTPPLRDHLGVDVYVGMLATLVARKSTAMPLSIGLFGEWGSGKSYFMELLHQQVDALTTGAKKSPDGPYLTDVVQIRFNAWHYADTDLWASLASEFFDQLTRNDTVAERRTEIATTLKHAEREQEALEQSAEAARAQAVTLRHDLAVATAQREQTTRTFSTKLIKAVAEDAALHKRLGDLADRIGFGGDDRERVLRLAEDVRATGDDLAATRHVVAQGSLRWPFALLVLAPLLLGAAFLVPQGWVDWLRGGAITAFAGVVLALGTVVGRARGLVAELRGVADSAREVRSRLVDEDEDLRALAVEAHAAEATEETARAEVEQAVSRVAELRRLLEQLQPGRRLYDFLAERAASTEYRSRLGVISIVRRDFEQLVELMDDWRRNPGAEGAREPINRIVLYIDDLDRCEPDQVVTVLQAVHLLLAMDLFVVVVGVDPRWLLRSLRRRYRRILGAEAVSAGDRETGFSESTPQNYLEKIFQVPFVLPAMGAAGFDGLVRHLARPRPPPVERVVVVDAGQPDAALSTTAPTQPAEARSEVAEVIGGARPATVTPITDAELALLTRLSGMVRTPRATTRLVNVYGLLRSTRNLTDDGRFLDTDDRPGDHQAVAQLLGILAAAPQLLGTILGGRGDAATQPRGLCRGHPAATWTIFVDDLDPVGTNGTWSNGVARTIAADEVQAWRNLVADLRTVRPAVTLDDIARYRLWGPLVARFSFLLAPFATDEPEPAPATAPPV
jgi:hypothetical protein